MIITGHSNTLSYRRLLQAVGQKDVNTPDSGWLQEVCESSDTDMG